MIGIFLCGAFTIAGVWAVRRAGGNVLHVAAAAVFGAGLSLGYYVQGGLGNWICLGGLALTLVLYGLAERRA